MNKILVSSCLLGLPVRYDGQSKPSSNSYLSAWNAQGRLVLVCPELLGGLAVPREPAEIQSDARIVTHTGRDVSQAFRRGATAALSLAQNNQIKMAILKANSPSCGNDEIYDGSFSGKLIAGRGETCRLLESVGITVFNENQIEQAAGFLNQLEKSS